MRALTLLTAAWAAIGIPGFGLVAMAADRPIAWHDDYAEGYDLARKEGKMLVLLFTRGDEACAEFEQRLAADEAATAKLEDSVCVRLPLDAKATVEDRPVDLLSQPAFRPLQRKAGLAIVDLEHRGEAYFGSVVSTLRFSDSQCPTLQTVQTLLDLPPGTPAQRKAAFQAALGIAQTSNEVVDDMAWLTDYARAVQAAQREGKMLLIHFCDPNDPLCRQFDERTWSDVKVQAKLDSYVCLKLTLDATVDVDGRTEKLLQQAAFRDMLGRPGLAIVDYTDERSRHYGTVVSEFPLTQRYRYTPQQVAAIIDLPPGTLTQRTMIYAVRIHPERPASTEGTALPALQTEAESHSQHQADIRVQGHHRWETRFHRVNRLLPGGGTSREVVAESWPGQGLLDAAIECVRCWRSSSGHWSAVRSRHPFFAYDMKLGRNGVWYATGIFGGR